MKTFGGRFLFIFVFTAAVVLNLGLDLLEFFRVHMAAWVEVYALTMDLVIVIMLGLLFWREQRARNQVEATLRETAAHMESANELLLQAELVRSRLLRTTVHDLKNPLGTIRGFADLIGSETDNHRTVQKMSDHIRRVSDHTIELVNSLLAPEVLLHGNIPLNRQKLSLNTFVTDIHQSLQGLAAGKKQNFTCSLRAPDLFISADRCRLRNVLFNVVGNAIKFSPMGADLSIATDFVGDKLVIVVDDEGPGFSAADKQKAFSEGQTLSAKPTGGEISTGMGLFSAQRNIQLHGGKIEIQDNPTGKGSRLIIEMP